MRSLKSRFVDASRHPAQPRRRRRASAAVEPLETRQLLAATLVQAPPAVSGSAGGSLAVDLTTYLDDPAVNTQVRFATDLGNIDLELFDTQKPISVDNFLNYVRQGRYDNTVIHRVTTKANDGIDVIQGGGFVPFIPGSGSGSTPPHIATDPPIVNEGPVAPILSNERGTIAMARTSDANSATSEWFINTGDNPLDPDDAPPAGYAVFGRVVNNTIGVADAIQDLPLFTIGGALQSTPLRNVQPNQQDLLAENYVRLTARTLPTKLTFTAQSSNPAVATPVIDGNRLNLNYVSAGTTQITITGTDGQGQSITQTFTATVSPASNPTVNLGGAGNPTTLTYTDADGTVGTIAFKGSGTAAIEFTGTGVTVSTVGVKATVNGAASIAGQVNVTGTTAATTLTVAAKGGDGLLDVPAFSVAAPIKALSAKPVRLTGNGVFNAAVQKVDLAAIGTDGTLGFQGANAPVVAITGAAAGNIQSAGPLKSITAASFGAAGDPSSFTASSVDKITSKGDFLVTLNASGVVKALAVTGKVTGDLTADGFGAVSVKGTLTDSTITATRAFAAGDKPLGKVTVSGAVTNSTIRAAGNITSVTTGPATGSAVYAGIAPAIARTTLPDDATDFAAQAAIGSVTIKGANTGTNVAAFTLGKVNLGTLTTANAAVPFGVAADSVKTLTGSVGGPRLAAKNLLTQADADAVTSGASLGDFRIVIL